MKNDSMPERRYKRGYNRMHLSTAVQKQLKEAEQTASLVSVLEAILTIASIPLLVVAFASFAAYLHGVTNNASLNTAVLGVCYLLIASLIARQQRGLEVMVHDASHQTWIRTNSVWNNLIANLFAAYPVLSSVETYWTSHRIHHGSFGSHRDPCRQRFANMGLSHLDLSTKWKIVRAVIAWLPSYNKAYYDEIGSLSLTQWACFALWHISMLIAPAAIVISWSLNITFATAISVAFVVWFIFWMIPFTVFLPVLRSIAEAEEHDYTNGETEFETTYTNDGWLHRALIHPKNDAYHLVHHTFPLIPVRLHRRIHTLLIKHDIRYQSALRRSSLFGPG